jgi:hypothetical protein
MKAHTKKLMARFDSALTAGGSSNGLGTKDPRFFQTMQLMVGLVEGLLPLFKEAFRSRDDFAAMIDKLDPSEEGYSIVLSFFGNLPRFGRYLATELAAFGKDNTVALRSGRPRKLDPSGEKEVVDFIMERERNCPYEKLSVRQEKAAKRFKISTRTCRRIWNSRAEPRLDFEVMKELLMSSLQNMLFEVQKKAVGTLPAPSRPQVTGVGAPSKRKTLNG